MICVGTSRSSGILHSLPRRFEVPSFVSCWFGFSVVTNNNLSIELIHDGSSGVVGCGEIYVEKVRICSKETIIPNMPRGVHPMKISSTSQANYDPPPYLPAETKENSMRVYSHNVAEHLKDALHIYLSSNGLPSNNAQMPKPSEALIS